MLDAILGGTWDELPPAANADAFVVTAPPARRGLYISQGAEAWALAAGGAATSLFNNIINVKDAPYNAKGDGATNDTAAIQAAINASTSTAPKLVYFPTGTYIITAALTIPFSPGFSMVGEGPYNSVIQQNTAGQACFIFANDLTHSVSVSDLTIQYPADQSNAGSVAFLYHVNGGSTGGFFHHIYSNLHLKSCYRGFSLFETDGAQTLWDTTWRNIFFEHITNRCVSMVSATPLGIPSLRFYDIYIQNTGVPAITSTGPAFYLSGVNEATFVGMDWEGWTDTLIQMDGGTGVDIDGLHVEHHILDTAFCRVFKIANGPFSIRNWTFAGATTANCTGQASIFHADSGQLVIHEGWHSVNTALGNPGIKDVVEGSSAAAISVDWRNIQKQGGNLIGLGDVGSNPAYTELLRGGRRQLTLGANIANDLSFPSRKFWISDTVAATARTIVNPTNPRAEDRITYEIQNNSGGVLGVLTWGTEFKLAGAWVQPANTKKRTITFDRDPVNSLWIENGRAAADI